MNFPFGSVGEESASNVGDLGSIPGLGRSPGEGKRLPTSVFWPGEFPGLYSPQSCKELDTTEGFSLSLSLRATWRGNITKKVVEDLSKATQQERQGQPQEKSLKSCRHNETFRHKILHTYSTHEHMNVHTKSPGGFSSFFNKSLFVFLAVTIANYRL